MKLDMDAVSDDLAVNIKKFVCLLGIAIPQENTSGGFGRQLVAAVGFAHQQKTFAAKNFCF